MSIQSVLENKGFSCPEGYKLHFWVMRADEDSTYEWFQNNDEDCMWLPPDEAILRQIKYIEERTALGHKDFGCSEKDVIDYYFDKKYEEFEKRYKEIDTFHGCFYGPEELSGEELYKWAEYNFESDTNHFAQWEYVEESWLAENHGEGYIHFLGTLDEDNVDEDNVLVLEYDDWK